MCWKCGKNIEVEGSVSRSAECPVCHADLHSCRNCIYYSPGSHYDCHETVDELVKDKERSNFCDNFKLKKIFDSAGNSFLNNEDKAAAAKNAFENLFSI